MFLQIGSTFYNQEWVQSISVYVDTKYDSLYVPMISLTGNNGEVIECFSIERFMDEDPDVIEEQADELREKLFQNLGIHNIKIDTVTGEVVC